MNQFDISALLPHRGSARMIDRVEQWDELCIVTSTATHRSAQNPLRKEARLAAIHLVEYGAQTMALHGALRGLEAGKPVAPALLVSVRDLVLHREYLEDLPGDLRIEARSQLVTPASWQYSFEVSHAGERIAAGRVAAMAYDLPAS